jgi:hypothetical protein
MGLRDRCSRKARGGEQGRESFAPTAPSAAPSGGRRTASRAARACASPVAIEHVTSSTCDAVRDGIAVLGGRDDDARPRALPEPGEAPDRARRLPGADVRPQLRERRPSSSLAGCAACMTSARARPLAGPAPERGRARLGDPRPTSAARATRPGDGQRVQFPGLRSTSARSRRRDHAHRRTRPHFNTPPTRPGLGGRYEVVHTGLAGSSAGAPAAGGRRSPTTTPATSLGTTT